MMADEKTVDPVETGRRWGGGGAHVTAVCQTIINESVALCYWTV